MAIRIRTIRNKVVAICAARSTKQKGDIYLDDNIHHALTEKFEKDFEKMGFLNDKEVNCFQNGKGSN